MNLTSRELLVILALASTLNATAGAQSEQAGSESSGPFKAPSAEKIYGMESNTPAFNMPNLGIGSAGMPTIDEHEIPSTGSTSLTGPQSESSAGDAPAPTVASDKPAPWYRYMTLGPDLARELQDSERKSLLPIVPTPPNLRATQNKRDSHFVLLRAANNERFGSFQTPYGQLFAKSGVIAFVATSQKVVRIMNLNGREGQMLFKMHNGQLLCIGAGTEMTLAPDLENMTLNAQDGIARRGITRLPKDGPVRLAFSQFSFDSFFELPEMKYFLTTQNKQYIDSLQKIASHLNEIRGVAGFRKAIDPTVIAKKPPAVVIQKSEAVAVVAKQPEATQQKASPPKVSPLSKASGPSEPGIGNRLLALGRKASNQFAETKEKLQALDARTDTRTTPLRSAAVRRTSVRTSSGIASASPAPIIHRAPAAPAVVLAKQSSTDSSLSTDARSKLFLAEIEERKAQKFRKQAKRSQEFVKGGFLTPAQSSKMAAEGKQFEVNAVLAQEKADKLRKEAAQISAKSAETAM